MKTTINQSDFVSAFKGNSERKNQFSYGALCALFDYYEEVEQSSGEEFELDVIGICCDWTEYDTALEAAKAYEFDKEDEDKALSYLTNQTSVLPLEGGSVVVFNF
jgi:hypothetical protein